MGVGPNELYFPKFGKLVQGPVSHSESEYRDPYYGITDNPHIRTPPNIPDQLESQLPHAPKSWLANSLSHKCWVPSLNRMESLGGAGVVTNGK